MLLVPEVALPVLTHSKYRDRDAAGVGQNVGMTYAAVRQTGSATAVVGPLAPSHRILARMVGVLRRDDVLVGRRDQHFAFEEHGLLLVGAFRRRRNGGSDTTSPVGLYTAPPRSPRSSSGGSRHQPGAHPADVSETLNHDARRGRGPGPGASAPGRVRWIRQPRPVASDAGASRAGSAACPSPRRSRAVRAVHRVGVHPGHAARWCSRPAGTSRSPMKSMISVV